MSCAHKKNKVITAVIYRMIAGLIVFTVVL